MTLRANSTAEKNGSRNTFYYWSTQNIISLSRISVTHKIYYVKIFLNIFFSYLSDYLLSGEFYAINC